MKKIAILGSTGSIGTQTLEVVRENGDIEVLGLAAGSNIKMLEEQIREIPGIRLYGDPDGNRIQIQRLLQAWMDFWKLQR